MVNKKQYVCQSCGSVFFRWVGKCDTCQEWNTIIEEEAASSIPKGLKPGKGKGLSFSPLSGEISKIQRYKTNIQEFDRVCGGGLVPGAVVLVGGDPGIGKSTLLLQCSSALSQTIDAAYISGEEAIDQIRMRAKRLGVSEAPLHLASTADMRDILATIDTPNGPKVLIIDSIQTMYIDNIESAPGTVSQVRACTAELIRIAKKRDLTVILVGHVTKEGAIAGPKVLEHMVDAVLYFEGDRGHQFRILRSVKNRFGAANEIGVFEMCETGLQEVSNPSALFLEARDENISGVSVFAGIEGTRPLLCEIQGLVAPSPLATPRRTVVGWDSGRLAMIIAVLEARCGISIGAKDVYLNVAGGLKISEPAADLAVAVCLLSSITNTPVPKECVIFGEVGLGGEIRPIKQADLRLKEASKLGFTRGFIPESTKMSVTTDMDIQGFRHMNDVLEHFNIKRRN